MSDTRGTDFFQEIDGNSDLYIKPLVGVTAQKALKAGDDKAARKLAHQAMDLVEATRLQAKIEDETWRMRVPK